MKKILRLIATFAMTAVVFAACGEEQTTPTPPAPGTGGNTGGNTGGTQTELKADFTFEVNSLTVQFTNASEGAEAYLWDFGDETTDTAKDPEHTYAAAGTYTVKLTVQDADGNAKSVEKEVTVAGAVEAYFTATAKTDRSGKFGKVFTFDASGSSNAASIVWDFGDGGTSTEFVVDHEFPAYEKYTVKATVTGLGGDTDVYEAEIEAIAYNELLKGGSMEADDAQYWTVKDYWMMAEDWSGEVVGTPQFTHEWGAQNGPAGGEGGCLRLGGESQFMQYSFKSTVYQQVELVAGDRIALSAQLKWNADTADNGLWWFCIGTDAETIGEDNSNSTVLEIFNYWAAGTALPAWDGDLRGIGLPEGCGYGVGSLVNEAGEALVSITEDGQIIYTVPADGTYYIGFQLRSVWGNFWGAGKDYYIDEISAKILL